jgi:hypothetical protein
VSDDVVAGDPVARLQPAREAQRGAQHARVAHQRAVGRPDVLDADRRPVQPHGVSAHVAQRHELVDAPRGVDDEVRARPGQLAQLRVGRVARERVPGRPVARVRGHVLDDDLRRAQGRAVQAVVPARVGAHLPHALRAERDAVPADRRTVGRQRGDRERLGDHSSTPRGGTGDDWMIDVVVCP